MNIILVGYSPERTRRALEFCALTFGSLGIRNRILVFNGAETAPVEAAGWEVLRGSNDLGEFSGWQEGLARIHEQGADAQTIFINDTAGDYRHLSVFLRRALVKSIENAGRGCIVGFTDRAPGHLALCGMPVSPWVSSYCFALSSDVLQRLGGRLWHPGEVESCVRGGCDETLFFTDRVSPDLQRHLRWWLFEGWHRSEKLSAESQQRLSFKARCICAELLLSARCRALAVEFRDPLERHPVHRVLEEANRQRVRFLFRLKSATAPAPRR